MLEAEGFVLEIGMQQPGFIRALVQKGTGATKVEWVHDTSWRFLPPVANALAGYVLQPVDLAVNKLLALVGREEPRDFLDIIYAHQSVLSLGALCWAAAGKDPGFTPAFLLTLLRRRGRYRPEDFARLHLREQPDLLALKRIWLEALDQAEAFVAARPHGELGCLYYSKTKREFVSDFTSGDSDIVPHFGRPGGVMPRYRLEAGLPRPTELASFVRALSHGELRETEPGWWLQSGRLLHEPYVARSRFAESATDLSSPTPG